MTILPMQLHNTLLKDLGEGTKPIAERKQGQFTIARVMHNDDPAHWQNAEAVELFVQGIRIAKVNRHSVQVYTSDLEDAIANGLTINTNKVEDKLRALVPSVWFARVKPSTGLKARWMVCNPSNDNDPYPMNIKTIEHGKVALMPERIIVEEGHYDNEQRCYVKEYVTKTVTVAHGAVPEHVNGWNCNWSLRLAKDAAFARHRRNVRSKVRAVERQYERVTGLWWMALGEKSWRDAAIRKAMEERQAKQEPAVRAWLAQNKRTTYIVDGVEYVDLYKGVIERGNSRYASQMGSHIHGFVDYTPGTMPEALDFEANSSCGRGLHMCATTTAVKLYVSWSELVICPVRVDEIQLIGWHEDLKGDYIIDKVKVPAVRLPIKHQKDVIL